MKASELIKALKSAIHNEGDLEVVWADSNPTDQSEELQIVSEVNTRHDPILYRLGSPLREHHPKAFIIS